MRYAEDELSDDPDECSRMLTRRRVVPRDRVAERDREAADRSAQSIEHRNMGAESGSRHVNREPLGTVEYLYEEDELSDNDANSSRGQEKSRCTQDPGASRCFPASPIASALVGTQTGINIGDVSDSGVSRQTDHKESGEEDTAGPRMLRRMPRQGPEYPEGSTLNRDDGSEHRNRGAVTTAHEHSGRNGEPAPNQAGARPENQAMHSAEQQVTSPVEWVTP